MLNIVSYAYWPFFSLEKYLLNFIFQLGSFLLSFQTSSCILDTEPISQKYNFKILSHFVGFFSLSLYCL